MNIALYTVIDPGRKLRLLARQYGEKFVTTRSTGDISNLKLSSGVTIPDSKLAREATELVRDTETDLLFNHSSRVYYFAGAAGKRKKLTYDPELLYIAAIFHDMGLTLKYSSQHDRFEVDGANAARDFLRRHSIPEPNVDAVWTAIALHTTPGIRSTCIPSSPF
jgi:HD superfamily phosphodiesterase